MKRGDIYFTNLDPAIGAKIQKKRPTLIVSNDSNNRMAKTATVVPLTSNVKKVYPFEVLIEIQASGLPKSSKAQCHQIRTISKMRIKDKKVGRASKAIMEKVDSAIKLHLDLF